MKKDLDAKAAIKKGIVLFYDKLLQDAKMRPFFEEIVYKGELENHLDEITNFWSDVVFDSTYYTANVMQKHTAKHATMPLKKEHFKLWMSYFKTNIDQLSEGEKA